MAPRRDFLVEMVEASIEADPAFQETLAAEIERRELLKALGARRREAGLSQVEVARRMRTTQAVVSRLESGEIDPQHSTEDRFAAAIGFRVDRRLVPADRTSVAE